MAYLWLNIDAYQETTYCCDWYGHTVHIWIENFVVSDMALSLHLGYIAGHELLKTQQTPK